MSHSDKGDGIKENRELAKESQDLQDTIKEVRKDSCIFILACLKIALGEQQSIRQVSKETAEYLYEFVRQECIRKGWIA